jgi:lipoate-protein ligase B
MIRPGRASKVCRVYRLGLVEYGDAFRLQKTLCQRRLDGEIPDVLLLVEHPATITIGKSGKLENILATREELDRRGVSVYFTDRGGDVTYHGPGQLVVYPIVDLRQRERDVHAYVRDLEECVIRTLRRFGIEGGRNSHAGVWVGGRQIAAIGIAIRRWITMHGISVNVMPRLDSFDLINPCGLPRVLVTSIRELAERDVSAREIADIVVAEFGSVLGTATEEVAFDGIGS